MSYIDKEYLSTQFKNFSQKVDDTFAKKSGSGGSGRSILSIRLDDENNVWVQYDDGSPEVNVGQLKVNAEADFLTVEGFGKLRYYQNRFQYYDVDTEQWVDTVVTPDNIYVVNMTPLPMKAISGRYITSRGHYAIKWSESPDTVIDGQVMCVVNSVVIRRKKDSAPVDINDGDFVIELPRNRFGAYKYRWYVDESFSPEIGDTYYYKAFPISATTDTYSNSTLNEVTVFARDYELYGFEINQNESDPEHMITYIEDNVGWYPAHMDYGRDVFEYGDWLPENAFFMNVRPCMLNYNGTVAYYLNPNNYAYKENGEVSDISNENFGGNAMAQFPKIYWKITDFGNGIAQIRITNKNFDGTYHCWSHIDENGNEIPYCYMPIYNGWSDGLTPTAGAAIYRLRSLSGKTPNHSLTVSEEITRAKRNNVSGNAWYTEVFSDRQLVNLLLLLIGKSADTQKVFGNGYCFGGTENVNPRINTGTMDTKGMFWGKNTETMHGVKVFGIENWWGNQWRRVGGYVCDKGVQKVKMTYGKFDGSTVDGYNMTGDGYVAIPGSTPDGTSGNYISAMIFSDKGLIPKTAGGTNSTYYADLLNFYNSYVTYAGFGSRSNSGFGSGALCCDISPSYDGSGRWGAGASISCKPVKLIQDSDDNLPKEVA